MNLFNKIKNSKSGFTLMEIVVVVSIMGILILARGPLYTFLFNVISPFSWGKAKFMAQGNSLWIDEQNVVRFFTGEIISQCINKKYPGDYGKGIIKTCYNPSQAACLVRVDEMVYECKKEHFRDKEWLIEEEKFRNLYYERLNYVSKEVGMSKLDIYKLLEKKYELFMLPIGYVHTKARAAQYDRNGNPYDKNGNPYDKNDKRFYREPLTQDEEKKVGFISQTLPKFTRGKKKVTLMLYQKAIQSIGSPLMECVMRKVDSHKSMPQEIQDRTCKDLKTFFDKQKVQKTERQEKQYFDEFWFYRHSFAAKYAEFK